MYSDTHIRYAYEYVEAPNVSCALAHTHTTKLSHLYSYTHTHYQTPTHDNITFTCSTGTATHCKRFPNVGLIKQCNTHTRSKSQEFWKNSRARFPGDLMPLVESSSPLGQYNKATQYTALQCLAVCCCACAAVCCSVL